MKVAYGTVSAEISTENAESAISEMTESLGIPPEQAKATVTKAAEIKKEALTEEPVSFREEYEPPLSENPEYVPFTEPPILPEFMEEMQEGFSPAVTPPVSHPVFSTPPEHAPAERMKLEQKRIAALCSVTGISPEDAAKALKKADVEAMLTSGKSTLHENFIGNITMGSQEGFIRSLSHSLGISQEEAATVFEKANTAFAELEKGSKLGTPLKTGGNGHESHIAPTQELLNGLLPKKSAAKLPETGISLPNPTPPIIPHTRRK